MDMEEKAEIKAEPYNQKYELSGDYTPEEEEDNSPIEEVRVTVSSKSNSSGLNLWQALICLYRYVPLTFSCLSPCLDRH